MQVRRTIAAWMLTAAMLVGGSAVAQERRSVTGRGGPIPEGTQVTIRMIDSLSSETAREGDIFHATLEQAILDTDGRTLYPKDADVDGRVVRAQPSGRLSDPGELGLVLTAISFGGQQVPDQYPAVEHEGRVTHQEQHQQDRWRRRPGRHYWSGRRRRQRRGHRRGRGRRRGYGRRRGHRQEGSQVESEALLTFVSLSSAGQYAAAPAARQPDRYPDVSLRCREPPRRPRTARNADDRDDQPRDHPRRRLFKPEFTNYDRQNIRGCFYDTANLPPGLARRDSLPPGLEKQLERNGTLPPELESRAEPLPDVCNARLPRLPVEWSRVVVGNRVLLLDPRSRIADLFNLDDEE